MLGCSVAYSIMRVPELDGVVVATSSKHNASRIHLDMLTQHSLLRNARPCVHHHNIIKQLRTHEKIKYIYIWLVRMDSKLLKLCNSSQSQIKEMGLSPSH